MLIRNYDNVFTLVYYVKYTLLLIVHILRNLLTTHFLLNHLSPFEKS